MAREKMSSSMGSAAVATSGNESNEIAAVSNIKYKSTSKKKANGKRGDTTSGGKQCSPRMQINRRNNGSSTLSPVNSKTSSVRSTKTLRWYIDDMLLGEESNAKDRRSMLDNTPSSSPRVKSNAAKSLANDTTEATANYMNQRCDDTPTSRFGDDERKKRRSRQRSNKKVTIVKAETNNDTNEDSGVNVVDSKLIKARSEVKETSTNYWYYDSKTDGFYYDWKNTHGWRRRNPVRDQVFVQMINKEAFPPLIVDPLAQFTDSPTPYSLHSNGLANHFSPQYQYDSESDGYYFTMPSVDGWKKRQPVNNQGSLTPNTYFGGSGFMHSAAPCVPVSKDFSQAAYAPYIYTKGPLTQCPVLKNSNGSGNVVISAVKEPFSSADSYSTVSSADGASPMNKYGDYATLFADEPASCSDVLNSGYGSKLLTDNESSERGHMLNNHRISPVNKQQPQRPFSYADVVNTNALPACEFNSSVTNETVMDMNNMKERKRPGTLELPKLGDTYIMEANRKGLELTNFNADKFIADLPFVGTERVLQNLAAMKTPCGPPSACSVDSPHTPAIMKSLYPSVKQEDVDPYEAAFIESMLSKFFANTGEKVTTPEASEGTRTTSKLSFWCDPNLVTGFAGLSCDAK